MPIDESQIPPDISRLRDSIDDELRTQFGMREIDIPPETILEIAYWVAASLTTPTSSLGCQDGRDTVLSLASEGAQAYGASPPSCRWASNEMTSSLARRRKVERYRVPRSHSLAVPIDYKHHQPCSDQRRRARGRPGPGRAGRFQDRDWQPVREQLVAGVV